MKFRGWEVASDGRLTVALDTQLTNELVAEGIAKELVNRIQNLRKEAGFEVTDRIQVRITDHDAIRDAIAQFGDFIKAEVLATAIDQIPDLSVGQQIVLPGEVQVYIHLIKE